MKSYEIFVLLKFESIVRPVRRPLVPGWRKKVGERRMSRKKVWNPKEFLGHPKNSYELLAYSIEF